MTVLEQILRDTRAELERRQRELPQRELERRGEQLGEGGVDTAQAGSRRGFRDALRAPGIGVIAEFKRRSPSAGVLRERADVAEIARAYERGGAVAMSVLTEAASFGGSLDDLRAARAASGLPLLRKDFVIDPYQLHEARLARADAVLLIVAALDPGALRALYRQAAALGLDALVEVHDARELRIALDAEAQVIGINNRDLRDFSVDVARTYALREQIPADVTVVSESGIAAPEQLARLRDASVAAVLVGEALMRARDPAQALAHLMSASLAAAEGPAPGR
jgi:indole-3-glycerol phosphate synthase